MSLDSVAANWTEAMWRACWQGSLAVLLVWLLSRTVLRRVSPSIRATLWWFVCVKCLIALVVGTAILVPILPQAEPGLVADSAAIPRGPAARGTLARVERGSTAPPSSEAKPDTAAQMPAWPIAVMGVWALGLAAMSVFTIRQAAKIRSVLHTATPLDDEPIGAEARRMGAVLGLDVVPKVVESAAVTAPMVVGFWRSTVILPAGFAEHFSEAEARMALAHELAHVRRRDLIVGLVPSLCQILFYFLPPMWLALREWSIEREAACDAEAVAAPGATRSGYGHLLLKIVTRDSKGGITPALGATSSYYTLKKRLEMIKMSVGSGRGLRIATLALVGFGLALSLPLQLSARAGLPPADGPNLLKNPGFEEGGDGFANWEIGSLPPGASTGVTISVDKSTRHSGKSSLLFQKSQVKFFPVALCTQEIHLDPNQTKIKVGMWVKAKDARKAAMAVMFNDNVQWGAYVGEAQDGDSPANHDWKQYGAVLAIPSGTTSITIALEMYGPGTVWIDDVTAQYVPQSTPLKSAVDTKDEGGNEDPLADVKDVPNRDVNIRNDPMERYFLIGPKKGPSATAYKLLVVLPGGDGSADFNPFVRRIWKNALPDNYIVAEAVAPKWSPNQAQQLVWPTKRAAFPGMKFTTEEFIQAIVQDVSKRYKIDSDKVYSLSWSSGGPAAYAAALSHGPIKGSFVAMSIFSPSSLPPLGEAAGHAFFILHSPDDKLIPIEQARTAADELLKAGAKTKLVTYPGGHGWTGGDVYGEIHDGIAWLESPSG